MEAIPLLVFENLRAIMDLQTRMRVGKQVASSHVVWYPFGRRGAWLTVVTQCVWFVTLHVGPTDQDGLDRSEDLCPA